MSASGKEAKPHIAVVISSLGAGGAERVISMLANRWFEQGYQVSAITLTGEQLDHFTLHTGIRRIRLDLLCNSSNLWETLRNNIRRLRAIRRAVVGSKADCVVSFIEDTNIRVLLALLGTGIPVIVSERTDPRHYQIGRLRQLMRRISYPLASALVVQTAGVRDWARQFLGADKIVVIPNPIAPMTAVLGAIEKAIDINEHTVFAMGRMGREKGFDMLLEAYARSNIVQLGWRLVILGDGRERAALQQQAERLGIAHAVLMPGAVLEPRAWLRHGGYFVLSSRFEGFPNALLEAMAEGLPAVAFNCESGPADIVREGVDGMLVPAEDVAALAGAMRKLAEDTELRARYAQRASEVLQRFALPQISVQWEALINRNIKHE